MSRIAEHEAQKYTKVWGLDSYAEHSPGFDHIDLFWSIAKPREGQTLLDIGAGNGVASVGLMLKGLDVEGFDVTDEGWKSNVNTSGVIFHKGCLWHRYDMPRPDHGDLFDFGYCCDVMEHIPTQFVGLAVSNALKRCKRVFFSISFKTDGHGDVIRDRLHLTVESFSWWRDTLREIGTVFEARDMIGEGVFYVGQ